MNHSDMEELLSAHANNELSRTQREFVEEHLAGCADCRAALPDYAWVRSQLTSLSATPISSSIKEAVMLNIEAIGTARRPVRRLMRPALIAFAIATAIVAALVVQLPGSGPGGPIARAYAATAGLQSYRMAGTTTVTSGGEVSEIAFESEFVTPNRYHVKMTTEGEVREFIIVGDEQYSRVSGSGESSETVVVITTGGYSVFNPIPSKEGTLQLLDSLTDLGELPDEDLDRVDTLHFRGRFDIGRIVDEQLAGLDPETPGYGETLEFLELQRRTEIDIHLWISKADYSIQQMRIEGRSPTTGGGIEQTGWMILSTEVRFYDLNDPIQIERPLRPSGDLEPEWKLMGSGPPAPTVKVQLIEAK